jgi:FMN phosphatase YigB (HAD superfamily)
MRTSEPKVITKTFTPLLSTVNCDKLENVVPALLERFSSSDGYVLHPDARSLLESLRESRSTLLGTAPKSTDGDLSRTIVGIISNSDPRVPNILRSFGLKVGPLHVNSTEAYTPGNENFDLDFTVLSYDAGFAKPDPKIFHAAESLVRRSLLPDNEMDELLTKLYVGDEFDNDGIAAVRAGWNAVIVDREGVLDEHFHNPVLKFPSGVDEKNTEGPVRTVERVTTLWPWNPFALRETV